MSISSLTKSTQNTPVDGEDHQSYRVHTEAVSFLILSKFRTSCGFVEDWEKNTCKTKKGGKGKFVFHIIL